MYFWIELSGIILEFVILVLMQKSNAKRMQKSFSDHIFDIKVVYNVRVLAHFATWDIFALWGISTFWVQKITRKIVKINENLGLFEVFMYNFLYQSVLIFPILIIFIICKNN